MHISTLPLRLRHLLLGTSALTGFALVSTAQAGQPGLPTSGVVTVGSATIAQPSANQLNIITSTNRTVIDWQSFSIANGNKVAIQQPGSNSITVNEVTGSDPSQIFGDLSSNGRVVLANPNGIWFGPNSHVDVAGLVASTATLSADAKKAFAAGGRLSLDVAGNPTASIVNDGHITIAGEGLAALVAPGVRNNGVIEATLGSVTLASGETSTLDFYGDGLVSLAVTSPVQALAIGPDGKPFTATIESKGKIAAQHVLVTADVVKGVVDNSINMSGVVEAKGVTVSGGDIVLDGGDGDVTVSGTLDVTSQQAQGGSIAVTGGTVTVAATAKIDASGAKGGGTIQIGGGPHGGGTLKHATNVLVQGGSAILTNATSQGDGGTVSIWSDGQTTFDGFISAMGAGTGNGGWVETSGHSLGITLGRVDASAPGGKAGTWLLDPYNLDIIAGGSGTNPAGNFSSGAGISTVNDSDINASLNEGMDVDVQVGGGGTQAGNITLDAGARLSWTTSQHLTLDAGTGNIILNGTIASTNTASTLTLTSTGNTTQTAPIEVGALELIGAEGNFTLTNAGNDIGILAANTGSVALNNGGNPLTIGQAGSTAGITLSGNLALSGIGTALTLYQNVTVGGPGGVDFTQATIGAPEVLIGQNNISINTSDGGSINLGVINNSVVGSPANLTISASGTINLSGAIGNTVEPYGVNEFASAGIILGANITTIAGDQFYAPVTLAADVTIILSNASNYGKIRFANPVDGAHALTINAQPTGPSIVGLDVPIGGVTPLTSLTVIAPRMNIGNEISDTSITTTGNQTFTIGTTGTPGQILLLDPNSVLRSQAGSISILASAIDGIDTTPHSLVLSAHSDINLGGTTLGGTNPLFDITLVSATLEAADAYHATDSGQPLFITGTAAQTVDGPVPYDQIRPGGAIIIGSTTSNNGTITATGENMDLTGPIDGLTAGQQILMLSDPGANIAINAPIGGTTKLGTLTINTSGNGVSTGVVTQSAAISTTALELTGAGANFILNTALNNVGTLAASTGSVTLNNGGHVLTIGTSGGTAGLDLTGDLALSDLGSTLTLIANVTVDGPGGVDFTQVTTGAAELMLADQNITIDTSAGTGPINLGAVDGGVTLTLNAGMVAASSTISLGGTIGGTTELASLLVTANGITLGPGVTVANNASFTGPVTLATDTSVIANSPSEANVQFASTIDGAHMLIIDALSPGPSEIELNAPVGGNTPLLGISLAAGSINLGTASTGGSIFTSGNQTLYSQSSLIRLYHDTVIRSQTGNVNVPSSSFYSQGGGPWSLVLSAHGTLDVSNNSFGSSGTLNNLFLVAGTITGTPTNNISGTYTRVSQTTPQTITNAIDYDAIRPGGTIIVGSITFSTGTINAAGENMDLTGPIDGLTAGQQILMLNDPGANIAINAPIGGSKAFGTLTINTSGDGVTTGVVTQSAAINTTALELTGTAANFMLTNALNNVGTLAASAGSVALNNGGHVLTIGTAGATTGVTLSGNLALSNLGATLTLYDNVTVSGPSGVDFTQVTTGAADVLIGQSVTIDTSNGTGPINLGAVDGSFDLTLNAGTITSGGTIGLSGTIGGSTPLNSLNLTSVAGIRLGGTITTAGGGNIDGPVTLTADTSFAATSTSFGYIQFASTIDGAHALTVAVAPGGDSTLLFDQTIGGQTPLSSFNASAGSMNLWMGTNNASITTTGYQTFSATVIRLYHDTVIRSQAGSVSLANVTLQPNGTAIVLSASSNLDISGVVTSGAFDNVTMVSDTLTGSPNFNNSGTLTTITTNGTPQQLSGPVDYDMIRPGGALTLTGPTTITASGENMDLTGPIDGAQMLTLSDPGLNIAIGAPIGSQAPLLGFNAVAAGISLGTGASNGSIETTLDQHFVVNQIGLYRDTVLRSDAGNLSLANASLNPNGNSVVLSASATIDFSNVITNGTFNNVTQVSDTVFGNPFLGHNGTLTTITTMGTPQQFSGPVDFDFIRPGGSVTLTGPTTITASGENMYLGGSIDGDVDLTLSDPGNTITLAGQIGQSVPLNSLTVNANLIGLGATISTVGDVAFNADLVVSGDAVVSASAGNISFNKVSGAGYNLTLSALGNGSSSGVVTFGGNIGDPGTNYGSGTPESPLGGLSITATAIFLPSTVTTIGDQTYAGGVNLVSDTTLTALDGNMNFMGTLDGAVNLTLITDPSHGITLAGAFGTSTSLASLMLESGQVLISGDVFTAGSVIAEIAGGGSFTVSSTGVITTGQINDVSSGNSGGPSNPNGLIEVAADSTKSVDGLQITIDGLLTANDGVYLKAADQTLVPGIAGTITIGGTITNTELGAVSGAPMPGSSTPATADLLLYAGIGGMIELQQGMLLSSPNSGNIALIADQLQIDGPTGSIADIVTAVGKQGAVILAPASTNGLLNGGTDYNDFQNGGTTGNATVLSGSSPVTPVNIAVTNDPGLTAANTGTFTIPQGVITALSGGPSNSPGPTTVGQLEIGLPGTRIQTTVGGVGETITLPTNTAIFGKGITLQGTIDAAQSLGVYQDFPNYAPGGVGITSDASITFGMSGAGTLNFTALSPNNHHPALYLNGPITAAAGSNGGITLYAGYGSVVTSAAAPLSTSGPVTITADPSGNGSGGIVLGAGIQAGSLTAAAGNSGYIRIYAPITTTGTLSASVNYGSVTTNTSGTLMAGGALSITATNGITLHAPVHSDTSINLASPGGGEGSGGSIYAYSAVTSPGNVTLYAPKGTVSITNTGSITSGGALTVTGIIIDIDGTATGAEVSLMPGNPNYGSTISVTGAVTGTNSLSIVNYGGPVTIAQTGTLSTGGTLTISTTANVPGADQITIDGKVNAGAIMVTSGNAGITLDATGTLSTPGALTIYAYRNIQLYGVASSNTFSLSTSEVANSIAISGTLTATGSGASSIGALAASIMISGTADISAVGPLTIKAGGDDTSANITVSAGATVSSSGGYVAIGAMIPEGLLDIDIAGTITGKGVSIASAGPSAFDSGNLTLGATAVITNSNTGSTNTASSADLLLYTGPNGSLIFDEGATVTAASGNIAIFSDHFDLNTPSNTSSISTSGTLIFSPTTTTGTFTAPGFTLSNTGKTIAFTLGNGGNLSLAELAFFGGGTVSNIGTIGAFQLGIPGTSNTVAIANDGTAQIPRTTTIFATDLTTSETIIGGGSLTFDATNSITLGGNITSVGGQTYASAVALASDVTLTAGGTGTTILFGGAIDSSTSGAGRNLAIVNPGGAVTFDGPVGSGNGLGTLDVTAATIALFNNVTTTGGQIYDGAVSVNSALALTDSGPGISFSGTVDGVTGGETLAVDATGATGTILFGGAVGGNVALYSVYARAGTITIANNVSTLGGQTYDGAVKIENSLTLSDGDDSATGIHFNSTVDGVTGTENLTLAIAAGVGGGVVTVDGAIGSAIAGGSLGSLTVNAPLVTGFGVTTVNGQTYEQAVELVADPTFTSTGNGTIAFDGPVNVSGAVSLIVVTGGAAIFASDVGSVGNPLASLSAYANGITLGGNVYTDGGQVYGGTTELGASTDSFSGSISLTGSSQTLNEASGSIYFGGSVTGQTGTQQLTVSAPGGTVMFGQALGTPTTVTNLETLIVNGGSIVLPSVVTTSGAQSYTGTTELDGAYTTSDAAFAVNGTASLLGDTTITTGTTLGGTVSFGSTIDGADALTITAPGASVSFGGAIGATTPVSSFTLTAGSVNGLPVIDATGGIAITLTGGSITLDGDYGFVSFVDDGAVTLSGDTEITTTGALSLGGPVDGAFALTLDGGTATSVTGTVGGTTALTSLDVVGAGGIVLGGVVTTTGAQTYANAVTLASATTLGSSGAIAFIGSVDGGFSLSIDAGSVSMATVGGTTALASLSIDAATANVGSVTTTGAQGYVAATTLGGNYVASGFAVSGPTLLSNDTVISSGTGNISFGSTVDGDQALTLDDANGSVTLAGAAGGVTPLGSLTINAGAISVGSVTTVHSQVFNGAAQLDGAYSGSSFEASGSDTLMGATSVTTTSGNLGFTGTVDGGQTLTLNDTGGTVTLGGAVGGTTALSSLTVTGSTISANSVTTTGGQSYTGATTLDGNFTGSSFTATGADTLAGATSITATGGNVAFGSSIDGAQSLTLAATNGSVTVAGAVGGKTALSSLTLGGGGDAVTFTGSVTTAELSDTRTSGSLTVAGGLSAATYVTAASNDVLISITGGSGPLSLAGEFDFTTALDLSGRALTLTGTTILNTSANNDALTLGTVDGNYALTLDAGTAVVALKGAAGANTALASLMITGGTISLGNVTTAGAQTYNGATTLNGTYVGSSFTANGIDLLGGATGVTATAGNISFSNSIDGGQSLSLTDVAGTVSFGSAIGAQSALGSLTITAAGIVAGNVATTGAQSYGGALTLSANATIQSANSDLTFGSTIIGTQSLILSAGGNIVFDGTLATQANPTALSILTADNVTVLNNSTLWVTTFKGFATGTFTFGNHSLESDDVVTIQAGSVDGRVVSSSATLDVNSASGIITGDTVSVTATGSVSEQITAGAATVNAGSFDGSIAATRSANIAASGDVAGTVTVSGGSASVSGANISGNVTASGLAQISATENVSADITGGAVNIQAGGTVSGNVTSTGAGGINITAANVSSTIVAEGGGSVDVTASGSITGSVTGGQVTLTAPVIDENINAASATINSADAIITGSIGGVDVGVANNITQEVLGATQQVANNTGDNAGTGDEGTGDDEGDGSDDEKKKKKKAAKDKGAVYDYANQYIDNLIGGKPAH